MNSKQAIPKIKKLLGKNPAWRENKSAPSADEREAAKAELPALRDAKANAAAAAAAHRRALLDGDAEYQRLAAAAAAASELHEKCSGTARRYRLTVGYTSDMAGFGVFHVRAEGDNWSDIVEKLERVGPQ